MPPVNLSQNPFCAPDQDWPGRSQSGMSSQFGRAAGMAGMAGVAGAATSTKGRNRSPHGVVKLGQDPFMTGEEGGQKYEAQEAVRPPVPAGPEVLEVMIRKAEGLPPPPKDNCLTRLEGNMEKWVTGTRSGSALPYAVSKSGKKILPVCIVQIKDRPGERVVTGPCTNGSVTDPVWGRSPDYIRGALNNWKEGDTLVFLIKSGEQVIAMKEMPYSQYMRGYEWWFSLDVADQGRYPEGWPFAAVQVKIHTIQGVKLTQEDPWMSEVADHEDKRGCCAKCMQPFTDCYKNCCFPCGMWYSRRCYVCFRSCGTNLCWLLKMCGLCCCMGCLECGKLCSITWAWCTGKNSLIQLRRDCAKRCSLPDIDEDQENMDTACSCVPLRTAVFLISVISTLNALYQFFFPSGDGHKYCGGYAVTSRIVVGATQLTGLFFGPVGIVGAMELSVSLLMMYNYYQIARLFGMLFMIYNDVPLLADCNIWRNDINAAIKAHGWNDAMYQVAMGNTCLQSQIDFCIGVSLHLCLYIYLISLTRRLIWDTEQTPKYILAMPRPLPNGSFVNTSRTQGRSKPPYGAALGVFGYDEDIVTNQGKLGPAGMPHVNTGPTTRSPLDRPYIPGHLPPDMMAPPPGGRTPPGTWHPNALPPQHRMPQGMPMGAPGFQY